MKIIKPTRNNVLIGFAKEENKTAGGIVLSGGATTGETKKGIVLGRGPECKFVEIEDTVIAEWGKASSIGDGQVMISEEHIWGILND